MIPCALLIAAAAASPPPLLVEAWIQDGPHARYPTRTLDHLTGFRPVPKVPLSRFGGWLDGGRRRATVFFRVEKIGARWFLIDPEGYPFIHIALNSVRPERGPQFRKAFPRAFRDPGDWARKTAALLRASGYNGTGAWSADEALASVTPRLVWTRKLSFMGSFGRKLGIVAQRAGHLGYPHGLIPVFHSAFEPFCRAYAREHLAATRDDPYLLGIFSDNELELPTRSLDAHLRLLPPEDAGRAEAEAWLRRRRGSPAPGAITDADREAWLAHVVDRYLAIVGRAIRAVDPHHLYLGPRFHGRDKRRPLLWKAAGRHLDAIAVNVYGVWTPKESVEAWLAWSGKPVIVTEWYAKGEDSGLANRTGAGWTVRTQRERGYFYEHFALSLLASRGCVGWHYFRYADNDPLDTRADPSNRDANKGIVNVRYEPYAELLEAMRRLNTQVYPLIRHLDRTGGDGIGPAACRGSGGP